MLRNGLDALFNYITIDVLGNQVLYASAGKYESLLNLLIKSIMDGFLQSRHKHSSNIDELNRSGLYHETVSLEHLLCGQIVFRFYSVQSVQVRYDPRKMKDGTAGPLIVIYFLFCC